MGESVFGQAFMPHGMCYLWRPGVLWLHVASDALTGMAYWMIPPFLGLLVLRSRAIGADSAVELPFRGVFLAFGVFIVACGATHFIAVWTVWQPVYWLSGGMKALTAVASVATAVALPPLLPRALNLLRDARDSERRRRDLEAAHADLFAAHAELAELYERIHAADRVKTDFFANVSHELRTPATLILGPVEQLMMEPHLTARDRQRLHTVQRNAHALMGQVDNLLDIARIDERRFEPVWSDTDLPGLVRRVASQFEEYAREHGIRLVVEAPDLLTVQVDGAKVERVLANLVSNAFKFTPAGGQVRCSVRQSRSPSGELASFEARGEVTLEVADSGPGIPPERRSEAFERFRQIKGTAARFQGSGLGLAIAREFTVLHGGTIEIGDAPEGGALLVVRLPQLAPSGSQVTAARTVGNRAALEASTLARQPAPAPRPQPAETADRARVLIVEDHAELAAWLAEMLETEYAVATAADGEEGLRMAGTWRPDLILTDLMMPGLSGQEMMEALREDPELAHTPVVVLSARPDADLRAALLEKGALDYVEKPVRGTELRARVHNLVELTRSRALLQSDLDSTVQDVQQLAGESATRRRILERTLAEKQALLQELHHRVKGNLQTIASLLSLQIRAVQDEPARIALHETRGRVAALATVHEMLYRRGDSASVPMLGYLRALVRQTVRTYGISPQRVSVVVEGDDVVLDADRAIAAGLIAHELVSNALRHAFPDERTGSLRVGFADGPDGALHLLVEDDGVGMPAEPRAGAMGLDLVRTLARQLDARVETRQDGGGTRVHVLFHRAEPFTGTAT